MPDVLEPVAVKPEAPAEDLGQCDAGAHVPHRLWDWRCARCWALLCLTCTKGIDDCQCPYEVRHG
jgi:hypothetical protein